MYIVAALLPVLLLIGYILFRDRENPEPLSMLLEAFVYGIISALVSLVFGLMLDVSGISNILSGTELAVIWEAFALAAVPEEVAKLLMLWLLLRKSATFDEHLDGVVYASCVGLGFAALENVFYIVDAGDLWAETAIIRGLLSVPGHFFFAVLMGYYYSLVHFGYHRWQNQVLVLAAPILAHGIYDTIAMMSELPTTPTAISFVVLLLFCNELRKLCQRHIDSLKEADRQMGYR